MTSKAYKIIFSLLICLLIIFSFSYYLLNKKTKKLLQKNEGVFLLVDQAEDSFAATNNDAKKSLNFKQEAADLDNNSLLEVYILENKNLVIKEQEKIIWQSPAEWQVDEFVLADANNDGLVDINLSVWKAGDFGSSQPFWIKENDMSIKNHFFIFDLIEGKIKAVWQSSNLSAPNCEFIFADVDDDQKNDLVVLEGNYTDKQKCEARYLAIWKWHDWGFTNEWRSAKAHFSQLELKQNSILVDSF